MGLLLLISRDDDAPVTDIVQVYDALLKPNSELWSPPSSVDIKKNSCVNENYKAVE